MKPKTHSYSIISDMHGSFSQLKIRKSDFLICAGDITGRGSLEQLERFCYWFENQNAKHKIFCAGNHDWCLQNEAGEAQHIYNQYKIHYLEDSGIELEGVKFWGSPITPTFNDWAFNRDRGVKIRKHWNQIPLDTDVLITHGPPKGILDKTQEGVYTGCQDLLEAVMAIEPKLHCFGHIHEAYGIEVKNDITFVNASIMTRDYKPLNKAARIRL